LVDWRKPRDVRFADRIVAGRPAPSRFTTGFGPTPTWRGVRFDQFVAFAIDGVAAHLALPPSST
jgi:hypothetical protein